MFRIKLIVYLIAISFSTFVHGQENNDLVHEVASRLCPYTDFCFKDATDEFLYKPEKYMPCCSHCECGEDCWLNGYCCPDLHYINPFENPDNDSLLGKCTAPFVKQKLNSGETKDNETYAFKVIDSCATNIINEGDNNEHKDLCQRENKTSLDDYIWVSDKVTGKIFKNWHCAACNGVAEYKFWQIQTNCEDILTQNVGSLNALLLSASCQIILEPPHMLRYLVAAYKCPQTFGYSRCNETGNWRDYDDVIEKACETFEWKYSSNTGTSYKNVFCFVCNENTYEVPLRCEFSDDAKHGGRSKGDLIVLLAYDEVRAMTVEEQVQFPECDVGEIKDSYMNKCRTLHCPIGRLAFYGTCKNIVNGIYNLDVAVAFYLNLRFGDPAFHNVCVKGDNLEGLAITVYDRFHEVLGFKDAKCIFVQDSLWINRGNQTSHIGLIFLAEVTAGSSDECTFDFVFAHSVAVIGQTVSLEVNGKHATLLVNFDKRHYDTIFAKSDVLVHVNHQKRISFLPKTHFRIQRTRACPLIELEYLELKFIPARLADKFYAISEHIEPTKNRSEIRVCVEDYMSMMSRANRKIGCTAICHLIVLLLITCP